MGETPEAKNAFREIFPQVVRTGSHFYEWTKVVAPDGFTRRRAVAIAFGAH